MSRDRRDAAATMTVGLAGTAGAGALRHEALAQSYRERGKNPVPRPKILAERRFIKRPRGRNLWLAGAGLGAVSLPAAAVGTTRTFKKADDRRESFLHAGMRGATAAAIDRTNTVKEKSPARLVAGNYVAGAAIGSAAGGLTHLALGRRKFPGAARSALASTAAVVAGTASLPAQSKLTQRASRGQYVVTPTGVRRAKRKPARPSSKATIFDGRGDGGARFHAQTSVGKMSPLAVARKAPATYRNVGAKAGAHWTVQGLRAADKIDVPDRRLVPKTKRGKLVFTGRTKAANVVRSASLDVSSLNDKDALARQAIHGHPLIGKRAGDDPGASMSRMERRARVTAAGPPIPIVGDLIQARAAGKYAAAPYRRRAAVENFAGGQTGNAAGMAAGAGGALGLASRSQGFNRRAQSASDSIDGAKANIRTKVGLGPAGPSMTSRAMSSPRTPVKAKRVVAGIAGSPAGRAVARNPKVAAVGALVGGAIGGQAGQQTAYGRIMRRDDRYRAKIGKADSAPMTVKDQRKLRRTKNQSAALSLASGATGLGALAATGGSAVLARRPGLAARLPRATKHLKSAPVPLLTTGAGIGGYNALNYAAIQHREARSVGKALTIPRPRVLGVRRAPAMRKGFIRQTRLSSGLTRVSSVRGGLA